MHDTEPELSVLIPARNEGATIGLILARALEVLDGSGEIVVVDDGSTDETSQIVAALAGRGAPVRLVRRNVTGGKGTAVRDGLVHCRGRFVILQDADLELDPAAYPALLGPLRSGRASLVNGSRFMKGRALAPWRTAIANRVLTIVGNRIYGIQLTDLCSGHKAIPTHVLRSLPLRATAYELESELIGLVARRGLSIEEVVTDYRPRSRREGKRIGVRDGLRVLLTIVNTRIRRL